MAAATGLTWTMTSRSKADVIDVTFYGGERDGEVMPLLRMVNEKLTFHPSKATYRVLHEYALAEEHYQELVANKKTSIFIPARMLNLYRRHCL